MANRSANSALHAIRKGVTITGADGNTIEETSAESAEKARLVGSGNSDRNKPGTGSEDGTGSDAGTGNENPGTNSVGSGGSGGGSGAATVASLGAKTAADYNGIDRPVIGTHPKTGKEVEIDYTQEGAGPSAPFGLLADGSPRIRRAKGSKPKSKSAGTVSKKLADPKNVDNVSWLAKGIAGIHTGIAAATKQPHWVMGTDESQAYADAISDLQSLYGFDLDPKTAAWMNLITVVGVGTGPRIMASLMMRDTARNTPRNVTPDAPSQGATQPKPPVPKKGRQPQTPSEMFAMAGATVDDFSGTDIT